MQFIYKVHKMIFIESRTRRSWEDKLFRHQIRLKRCLQSSKILSKQPNKKTYPEKILLNEADDRLIAMIDSSSVLLFLYWSECRFLFSVSVCYLLTATKVQRWVHETSSCLYNIVYNVDSASYLWIHNVERFIFWTPKFGAHSPDHQWRWSFFWRKFSWAFSICNIVMPPCTAGLALWTGTKRNRQLQVSEKSESFQEAIVCHL